jgi:hypothetical protein
MNYIHFRAVVNQPKDAKAENLFATGSRKGRGDIVMPASVSFCKEAGGARPPVSESKTRSEFQVLVLSDHV